MSTPMDSVKETCAKAIAFAGRSKHDVSESTEQYWAHLNAEAQDAARSQADAIMALLPQVGVKELEWRKGKTQDAYKAHALGSMVYAAFHAHDDRDWCAVVRLIDEDQDTLDFEIAEELPTLEAAQAACQADFAQRITSALVPTEAPSALPKDVVQLLQDVGQFLNSAAAHVGAAGCRDIAERMDKYVEQIGDFVRADAKATSALAQPSGVVSADLNSAVRAVLRALLSDFGDPAEHNNDPILSVAFGQDGRPMSLTYGQIAALTAALISPVSEGEISPAPDIPRDEPTVRVQIHGGGVAGVDESIAPLVKLLNDGCVKTSASCSGHDQRPGNITLADGRELIIARSWNEARLIDSLFPGINGEPASGVEGALEFIRQSNEEIRAAEQERICAWIEDSDPELAEAIRARSFTNGDG